MNCTHGSIGGSDWEVRLSAMVNNSCKRPTQAASELAAIWKLV